MEKLCKKCNTTKILGDFHYDSGSSDGHRTYCKVCSIKDACVWSLNNKEKRNNTVRNRRAKDKLGSILSLARQRARNNNLEFSLTREDVSIPETCPVLGIEIKCANNKLLDSSPTIDRIDSSLGYIKGNVLVISWRANRLKSDATISEVRCILKYMEAYNSNEHICTE